MHSRRGHGGEDAGEPRPPETPEEAEALFLEHLPFLERSIAFVCRRNGFPEADGEDFASWAKLRLIEDDYAILRKFRGTSKLTTFLTVVVRNLFRDYRIKLWGKWRPSAAAKRLGPTAVRLERMVSRDGRSVEEAIESLKENQAVAESRRELERLAGRLPERVPRRFVGEEALEGEGSLDGVESRLRDRERAAAAARVEAALERALDALEPRDRLLLKMHYRDGFSIATIARTLEVEQRPLYSRRDRAFRRMRRELGEAGVEWERVEGLLGWERTDLSAVWDAESGGAGPSPKRGAGPTAGEAQ